MWLLIISVATFIFSFWGSSVYALDIAIQPDDNGLYSTTQVSSQDVVIEQSSLKSWTPNTTNWQVKNTWNVSGWPSIKKDSDSWLSPVEKELWNLLSLETSFPWSNVYYWNNTKFYELLIYFIDKKDNSMHETYLEKTIEMMQNLTPNMLKKYNLNWAWIVSALTAVKLTLQNDSAFVEWTNWNNIYKIENLNNWRVNLHLVEWVNVKRISFFVNGSFENWCEWDQCTFASVNAVSWDTITANVTYQGRKYETITIQL